jgi:hypothetical protein
MKANMISNQMEENDKLNLFRGSISPMAVSVFSRMKNLAKRVQALQSKRERLKNSKEGNIDEMNQVKDQLHHCLSELRTLSLMSKEAVE